MSIAKNARASHIMDNMKSGHYQKQGKFADFGSVPEDSIYYHTLLPERADQERREKEALNSAERRIRRAGA